MDNIYVTLSHLHSLDRLVVLQDITIQDIHKTSFKKRLLKMTKPILEPNVDQINTPIHHDNLVQKLHMFNISCLKTKLKKISK
jgi:hypothetical protein